MLNMPLPALSTADTLARATTSYEFPEPLLSASGVCKWCT
ncbi:hypothetical protein FHX35_001854 [Auritidibacter ignavus]|nr:hypothetical protein [Auritidibacter ignavus]